MTSSDERQKSAQSRARYIFYIAFVASLGGFLFGYDLVIISGAQIFIRDQFALTPRQFGFATSSALLGCVAGPFLAARISDRHGRKAALLSAAFLFAVGAIGSALARDITVFNIFRIFGGVGVGIASVSSPLYITEIAPAESRGRLGLMYQLAITIGCVAATITSYLLARYTTPTVSWRWMFASVLVPVIVFSFLLIPVPASPRWLAERRRFDEALVVLTLIGGEEEGRRELLEIEASMHEEIGSIHELLRPGMRKTLATGVALAIFNAWTGWTALSFYLPTLFQQAGFVKPSDAIAQNIFVNGGAVLLTLLSISLIDKLGRRPIWIACSAGMCLCLILSGILFQCHATGEMVVIATTLCAVPYSIGLGPLPWLMMSEIFPTRVRAKAVGMSTTILWIAGFTSPLVFPPMEAASNEVLHTVAGVFWFYSVICFMSFLWGWKYLPETSGRTLEDVAHSLNASSRIELR